MLFKDQSSCFILYLLNNIVFVSLRRFLKKFHNNNLDASIRPNLLNSFVFRHSTYRMHASVIIFLTCSKNVCIVPN